MAPFFFRIDLYPAPTNTHTQTIARLASVATGGQQAGGHVESVDPVLNLLVLILHTAICAGCRRAHELEEPEP
jgi:hypothetical protein